MAEEKTRGNGRGTDQDVAGSGFVETKLKVPCFGNSQSRTGLFSR